MLLLSANHSRNHLTLGLCDVMLAQSWFNRGRSNNHIGNEDEDLNMATNLPFSPSQETLDLIGNSKYQDSET